MLGNSRARYLLQALGFESLFVHVVEGEAAAQEGLVEAVGCLAHVLARVRGGGAFVEELSALAHDDADIGDGAARLEVSIMPGGPAKVVCAYLLPSTVFSEAVLRADEVKVGNHAAGERLVQPHLRLGGVLGGIAPADDTGGVGGGDVGGELAVLHGVADAALQGASPDGGVVVGAALVVALKPGGDLTETGKIRTGMNIAAEVREVKAVGLLLFGDGIYFCHSSKRRSLKAPSRQVFRGRKLAADAAVALGKASDGRPSVHVEAIDIVERVDLSHDGRHVVVHVGGEHAGLEEAWIFAAELYGAVFVAHGPFGVGLERVSPVEVGAHARNDAHAALFGGGDALAKEVAAVEKLSLTVELHLRGIEGEDAGDAYEDDVRAGGVPVVGPLLYVHDGGVMLGHVALADAAHLLLPGEGGGVRRGQTRW